MSSILKKITAVSGSSPGKINSRLFTFFICLVVSVFFWLLMSLSKDHAIVVNFPVKYINLPKDKVLNDYLPESIELKIKGKGFSLLAYKFKNTKEIIVIDLKDARRYTSKNTFYILTNSRLDKIASQFSTNISILRINPDTIYFTYNKKITKTVPVKVISNITFADEYQLSDSIKITPEFIKISGSAEMLDKIKFIETIPLVLNKVDEKTKVKLALQKTDKMKFVEFSKSEVMVSVNVVKFAEASIELPIEIENLPSKYNLKIFPDKVNVTYKVAFENYEKVSAANFKAVVNYKTIEKASSKIKIQLTKMPDYIKIIRLSPEKAEYILRK